MRKLTVIIIPLLVLVAALTLSLLLKNGAVSHTGKDAHEVRLGVARRAIEKGPESAPLAERPELFPDVIHGCQSRSGSRVSYAMVFQRCFDLAELPRKTDESGGVVAMLLENADAHRRELAAVGFVAIEGRGHSFGSREPFRDRTLHLTVAVKSPRGSGHGGYQMNLNNRRFVHHRIYLHPQSASTVFVRQDYDDETKRLIVELSYSDRTILGQVYKEGPWELSETIDRED